jgi:hypothetical protein
MTLPEFFTTAEVADSFGCSQRFLLDKVKAKVVLPMRLGDRRNAPLRWTADDVAALRRALTPAKRPARERKGRAA